MRTTPTLMLVCCTVLTTATRSPGADFSGLSRLDNGKVRAENGLWIETPPERQFKSGKEVVVADVKGPGVITMIHFALPNWSVSKPKEYTLGRELIIKMWWDGEAEPSVNCPFVDFFCDPAGFREQVNTALVNKRRGWNAYFPMPFRQSARITLVYEGPQEAGETLWAMMPCYSYIMWRSLDSVPADQGYFHAHWRQRGLLIGKEQYVALEAKGRGKFVGWNVTMRRPGSPAYPVDMNEKFRVDGEKEASVEFQGIEDSFGFSWGFPENENVFPLAGYWPFKQGAMAYRFFINDAITFEKSLEVAIGFGEKEDPMFHREFSKPGSTMQFSSTVYWYQTEPHAALPPMPAAAEREPAPEEPFWPDKEQLPGEQSLRDRNVKLHVMCGRPKKEVFFAEPGFGMTAKTGYTFAGWPLPVYHTRADNTELKIDLTVPKGAAGTLRLYIADPDTFEGGRRQQVFIGDKALGTFERFQEGKWIETGVTSRQTQDGMLAIRIKNLSARSNAVLSVIEWIGAR
ncbi:MAG TPA: DUF2961 domain-containing protein [Phycisphaerae bacterium]|nr:DUF2961 domain-containing protein [Phycisphaerae bacterium]HRY67938.1 DUF2961 domain-containing protein [Phycisphaerae bacterium]HSA26675.1 DUF2961 domain-containing protein [Phycisphaerae bacterium]